MQFVLFGHDFETFSGGRADVEPVEIMKLNLGFSHALSVRSFAGTGKLLCSVAVVGFCYSGETRLVASGLGLGFGILNMFSYGSQLAVPFPAFSFLKPAITPPEVAWLHPVHAYC